MDTSEDEQDTEDEQDINGQNFRLPCPHARNARTPSSEQRAEWQKKLTNSTRAIERNKRNEKAEQN